MAELSEVERSRLDAEWALVSATREALNIALRREQSVTYRQALNVGEAIAPSVLAKDRRLLRGIKESEEARYYEETARAESAATGREINRMEVLERDIAKMERDIKAVDPDSVTLMKGRLEKLKKVRQELKPKTYTENQLIIRDAMKVDRWLPVSGEGTDYKEYLIDNDRRLRVRVLHPDPPEHKIGADLIYEHHDLVDKTVRIAVVQYKLWDGKSLSFDDRMGKQLARMRGIGCDGGFCKEPESDPRPYRLPHCAVFLRPTDSLQGPNSALISSGLHIPLCVVERSWVDNNRGGRSLRKRAVAGQSVSHRMFESLFNDSLLGSARLDVARLEELYKKTGILDSDESIILHAQEYSVETERPRKRGTASQPT